MEEGWEPCGPVMMSATDPDGNKGTILAWGIKRKYSPLRESIERTSKLARARVVTPPLNGHGR
jgi:hypothetical protein